MDRGGQDLIDERVRNVLIGEAADRALAAKQLVHVADRLHPAPPGVGTPIDFSRA